MVSLFAQTKKNYGLSYDEGHGPGVFRPGFRRDDRQGLHIPLANSDLGVKAKLAPNSGTFVQFRKFGDLSYCVTYDGLRPVMVLPGVSVRPAKGGSLAR